MVLSNWGPSTTQETNQGNQKSQPKVTGYVGGLCIDGEFPVIKLHLRGMQSFR